MQYTRVTSGRMPAEAEASPYINMPLSLLGERALTLVLRWSDIGTSEAHCASLAAAIGRALAARGGASCWSDDADTAVAIFGLLRQAIARVGEGGGGPARLTCPPLWSPRDAGDELGARDPAPAAGESDGTAARRGGAARRGRAHGRRQQLARGARLAAVRPDRTGARAPERARRPALESIERAFVQRNSLEARARYRRSARPRATSPRFGSCSSRPSASSACRAR